MESFANAFIKSTILSYSKKIKSQLLLIKYCIQNSEDSKLVSTSWGQNEGVKILDTKAGWKRFDFCICVTVINLVLWINVRILSFLNDFRGNFSDNCSVNEQACTSSGSPLSVCRRKSAWNLFFRTFFFLCKLFVDNDVRWYPWFHLPWVFPFLDKTAELVFVRIPI